jgi:tryptophanyl-tRNA synthetase
MSLREEIAVYSHSTEIRGGLVLIDDALFLKRVAKLARELDIDLRTVSDASEAIAIASSEWSPAFVVIDRLFTRRQLYETTRALRLGLGIPVLAVCSHSDRPLHQPGPLIEFLSENETLEAIGRLVGNQWPSSVTAAASRDIITVETTIDAPVSAREVPTVAQTIETMEASPVATRKRVFSGIQPSGDSHIGNYLGAIRNWVVQQEQYDNVFCIVNLHALTLPTIPEQLIENSIGMTNVLLAAGIDPANSILFLQSDVREHSELCWLLASVCTYGELSRMTQFKDKTSGKGDESISSSLFFYPILQAADILLYDTDLVPVGDDQKQHIELARDIAQRFNGRYDGGLVVPQPDIKKDGARIMSLDDPTRKMSKSVGGPNSCIYLVDDADTITRKIKRAVTDSGSTVEATPDKPALTNLLTIYSLFSGESIETIVQRYEGKGYGAFKSELAEVVVNGLAPIQQRLVDLNGDPSYARNVLSEGADRARETAVRTMERVRGRMGIVI